MPALGVLPALKQLNLGGVAVEDEQWVPLGGWLGLQPRLEKLSLRGCAAPGATTGAPAPPQQADALSLLPTRLEELDLSSCGLQQWPQQLSQMTRLEVLLVGGNEGLRPQLPPWLPGLQRLWCLEVQRVEDAAAAVQLLKQLPKLRHLNICAAATTGKRGAASRQVYEQLPALQPGPGEYLCGEGLLWDDYVSARCWS